MPNSEATRSACTPCASTARARRSSAMARSQAPGRQASGCCKSAAGGASRKVMAEPLVDEVTLARAMRGDEGAFRVLVTRHEAQVFALIGRILVRRRGQGIVEDLAQETFVRVFHALPSFGRDGRWNLTA